MNFHVHIKLEVTKNNSISSNGTKFGRFIISPFYHKARQGALGYTFTRLRFFGFNNYNQVYCFIYMKTSRLFHALNQFLDLTYVLERFYCVNRIEKRAPPPHSTNGNLTEESTCIINCVNWGFASALDQCSERQPKPTGRVPPPHHPKCPHYSEHGVYYFNEFLAL